MAVDFTRTLKRDLHIEITPLIDVVFQLLVFFMLTSVFAAPAIELTLPKLDSDGPDSEPSLIVQLNAQDEIFINERRVAENAYVGELNRVLGESEDKAVYFRGDSAASYEKVLRLMQQSTEAGASRFNFIYDIEE